MKKQLFMLGLAAAVMTSCSKSETLGDPGATQQQAIGFSSYVSSTTRSEAPDNDVEALQEAGKGFYVHGAYMKTGDASATPVFDGGQYSHVTWTGDGNGSGSWGYAPINYWLAGATYKFAAFAPALDVSHTFDYAKNCLTIKDFVADGKTDLVVAATAESGIVANSYISSGDPVGLSFRHALSKVRISFKNGWRNAVTLKINEISLSGLSTKGTLNTPSAMTAGLGLANWNPVSPIDANESAPVSLRDGAYVDDNGNGDGTDVYEAVYPFENFMIPQVLQENAIELSFRVTVTNGLGTGPDLGGDGSQPNTTVIKAKLPVNEVKQWLPGYSYNYIITISGSTFGLHPITFEVESVEGWTPNSSEGNEWTVNSTSGSN